jgi:hypothetical protein
MTHPGSNHGSSSRASHGSVPLSGTPRLSPGELPVVEGGGIPETDDGECGISELEAAAMLADFGGGPADAPTSPARDGSAGMTDAAPDPSAPRAATPEAIPMATSADVPPHGHPGEASTIPPAHAGDARFRAIGVKARRHEDSWSRTPNATGTGAIHVRTFMSKLTEDGFHALDARVNEWLDAHPQYEVKFVNTSIGTVTGKSKEAQLICQVWV